MVAMVGGSGLGLLNSSAGVLGGAGVFGNAIQGGNKEAAYLNIVNGNLTLQDSDDFLAAHGINIALTRTYNSQGSLNDGNGVAWKYGLARTVAGLTGTVNTAGSTVSRTAADGSVALYTYDTTKSAYVTTDGGGAYQSMTFDAAKNQWTWRADRFDLLGVYEIYDGNNGGRLDSVKDQAGLRQKFFYNASGRLSQINDAAGTIGLAGDVPNSLNDLITFEYDALGNLVDINTRLAGAATADGAPNVSNLIRVRYTYDALNRLASTIVDLSTVNYDKDGKPLLSDKNISVADGNTYVTTYSYDGDSNRIANVSQSDGTSLSFGYQQIGGVWKVSSYTDGLNRTTTLDYTVPGKTTVTDPLGYKTVYGFDAKGQLTDVTAPAVGAAAPQVLRYTYDAKGNVTQVTDARGLVTTYGYDVNGNRILERDAAGNTIARNYNLTNNLLLGEARYATPDPDGAGAAAAALPLTTRYLYSVDNRLHYVFSPEGRVTEYRYNALGEVAAEIHYESTLFGYGGWPALAVGVTEAYVNSALAGATFDKTKLSRTDFAYDARGLRISATRYANTDTTGAGLNDGLQSITRYVYDQAGQLLASYDGKNNATTYVYDGMGRVLSTTDAAGNSVTTLYDDQRHLQIVRTIPAGTLLASQTIIARDAAGQLISVRTEAVDAATGSVTNTYDADGRLRMSVDGAGQKTWWLYDEAGRKVAQIEQNGALTEFVYNADNQLTRTIQYATTVSTSGLLDAQGRPLNLSLATLRPTGATRSTYNSYDLAGRLNATIDANGYLTRMVYDGASRLVQTIYRAKPIADLSVLDGQTIAASFASEASADDRIGRQFYSDDGLLTGKLDPLGYLTEYVYNQAGLLTDTVTYAALTNAALRATGALASLRPAANATLDIHQRNLYNGKHQLIASIDGDNFLTEYSYDAAGNLGSSRRYATAVTAPAALTVAALGKTASADDRLTSYSYNALNQLERQTDPAGTYSQYSYDFNGKVVSVTRGSAGVAERSSTVRYDANGRLSAELSAEGASRLAALPAPPDAAAVAGIWALYATHYSYDATGLRTSMTDGRGVRTLYFYDSIGRLTHTVNGAGEVTEQRYNSFNQVVKTIQYGQRIAPLTLETLSGGRNDANFNALTLAGSGDTAVQAYYDNGGRLRYTVDGAGQVQERTYNAYGQVIEAISYGSKLTGAALALLSGDAAADKLASYRGADYQRTLYYYDTDGRLNYTVNPMGEVVGKTYNAAGQVLSATQYALRAASPSTLTGAASEIASFAVANAANSVVTFSYNRRGGVLDQALNSNHTLTTYNAFGEAIKVAQLAIANSVTAAPTLDRVTQTVYDANGRVAATIDPTGTVTAYLYDSDGHVIDQVRYANPLAGYATSTNIAKTYSDALAAKQLSDAARDQHQRFIYNGDGDLIATLTAQSTTVDAQGKVAVKWAVVRQTRDLDGRVIARTAYAQRMDSATLTPDSAAALAWMTAADASNLADPAGSDALARYVYDGAGRLLATATAQRRDGSNVLQWAVTRQWYDTRGNVTQRTGFNGWLSGNAPTDNDILLLAASPSDAITAYEYDGANRVITTAVARGPSSASATPPSTQYWEMTALAYDSFGNVSSKTQYANVIASNNLPAKLSTIVNPNAQADRVTRYRYDAQNRLVVTIDAAGAITRQVYDSRGNVVQSIAYADPTTTPDAITASYAPTLKASDRVIRTVYDLQHQPIYQIDALGQVTERSYDTLGNLTSVIRYATALTAAKLTAMTTAGVDALPAAIKTAMALAAPVLTLDRVERYAYDQDGQLRYTVDAAGYLKETVYNALGQVAETRNYLQLPTTALPLAPTAAQLLAEATRQLNAGYAAVTKFTYDAQGNLASSTDPLNATETYQYDGLRNKISYTNKAGNTWTYRYDAAGRMVQETSPQVAAYSNGIGVPMGGWGAGTQTALVTLFEYDALGNLTKRTEAANTASQRETRYVYDTVGRQTQTILQPANVYNDSDPASSTAAGRTEINSGDRYTTVVYNAFGDAVANIDVGGQVSYKVYDQRGQVAYDVDALGYVTAYQHDSFGNVTALTRYANTARPLDSGLNPASVTAAQFSAQIRLDGANDRTIRTAYDLLGRVVRVSEPVVAVFDQHATGGAPYLNAGKTTDTSYNTFGDTIATSVYGADSSGARVTDGTETRYYYDARGNKTAEISALTVLAGGHTGTGYLTTYAYGFDIASKTSTVRKTEYANSYSWNDTLANGGTLPTAAAGLDRVTQTVYDKRGQLLSSTNVQVSVYEAGKQTLRDVVTSYTYDSVGNQTSVTDGLGGTVFTYYDKLGRTIGVAKAQTVAYTDAPNSGSPITEFKLDILGNILLRIDYARNPAALPTVTGAVPLDVTDPNNRVTATRYDRDGHAIAVQDAEQFVKGSQSSLINTSYDVYGRVAKQWRSVTANYGTQQTQTAFQINRYDALGRIREVLTPGAIDLVNNSAGGVTHKSSVYNAFGEVTATGLATSSNGVTPAGGQQITYARYDQAGRAWLSNAGDGVDRATLYDALGQATAQVVSSGSDLHRLQALTSAAQVKDEQQVLRTETRYDLLGHVVDSRQIDDPRLTVLTRVNGAWVRTRLDNGSAVASNLILVGDITDRANSLTVKYRLAGSSSWITADKQRLQWLDDNLAFSTAGLPSGSYEYAVSITPPGETAFDRNTGSWTVDTVTSPQSAQLLGQAYLAVLHRGADLVGLNFYVDLMNKGQSLASLLGAMLNSTEAATYAYMTGNSQDVMGVFLKNLGRGSAADTGYAADLVMWSQRYDAARKQGGDAPAQLLLDIIDSVASYAGTNGGMLAAKTQLANQLKVTLDYAQIYKGTLAATARDIAAEAVNNPSHAAEIAQQAGNTELWSSQITQLYLALFGRAPEKGGMDTWISAMNRGLTLEQAANGMLASPEARDPLLYPDQTTTSAYQLQLVRTVYQTLLGRAATSAEETDALAQLNGKPGVAAISNGQWVIQLTNQVSTYNGSDSVKLADKTLFNNRVAVGLQFAPLTLDDIPVTSRAAVSKALMSSIGTAATAQAAADAAVAANATAISVNTTLATLAGTASGATVLENMRLQLSRMYVVLLNRTLDTAGLNYQLQNLMAEGAGMPSSARWAALATALMGSAESQADPTLLGGALSDSQFVERLYTMALGKLPTSAAARSEIAGYVAQLATMSRGQVAINVMNGMMHFADAGAEDTALLRTYDNKVAVSLACAVDLGSYGWAGAGAIQTGREVLGLVTATDTTTALNRAYTRSQESFKAANASLAASSANAVAALNAAKAAATAASQAATAAQTAATAANAVAGANNRLQLLALYVGVLGRDQSDYSTNPDLVGLDFEAEQLANFTMDAVAQGFVDSPEGQKLYPTGSTSNEDFVAKLYSRVLGSTTAGQDFYGGWVAKLSPPTSMTRGQVALGIVNQVLNYANYTPTPAAVTYMQSRQNLMARLSSVAALVDSGQAAAVAAAVAALAGKTQPAGTVDSLKAAVDSTAKAQADALAAVTTALNTANANAAGDGSATMRLQVTRLFATLLQYKTSPTLVEMNNYLASGLPLETIAQQMINANPALFPADNSQFVVALYKNILGRDIDSGDDITLWTRQLVANAGDPNARGRAAVGILNAYLQYTDSTTAQITAHVAFDTKISGFLATQKTAIDKANSDAAAAATAAKTATTNANTALTNANKAVTTAQTAANDATMLLNAGYGDSFLGLTAYQNQVVTIYAALRGTGDVPGMAVWMRGLASGSVVGNDRLINDIMAADKYPADSTAFVQKLYAMVLGRTGTADEYAFWAGPIIRGELTRVQVASRIIGSAEGLKHLPDVVAGLMPGFNAIAQGYLDKRTAANANVITAQQQASQASANLDQAKLNEAAATAAAAAAAKVAQTAAALATAYAKVTAATTAALNAAKARDNYDLGVRFAALNKAKAYAAADHAVAVLAAANQTLAAAQVSVASRYATDASAPSVEREATAVARIYQAVLNRAPLLTELNYWTGKLSSDLTPAELANMAASILATPEGLTAYPASMTNDAFVTKMYLFGLNRGFASDPNGLRFWSDQLTGAAPMTRAQLIAKWVNTVSLAGTTDAATFAGRVATSLQVTVTEAQNAPNLLPAIQLTDTDARNAATAYNASGAAALAANAQAQNVKTLTRLYIAILNRVPDAAGVNTWLDAMAKGSTLSQIANGFIGSAEGLRLYPTGMTNHDYIKQLLNNVFGRVPTEAEITPYVTALNGKTRGDAALNTIAAIADGGGGDLQQMTARLSFNSRVSGALDRVGAEAASNAAMAQTIRPLLLQIQAQHPVDLHTEGVVAGTATVARNGAQQVLGASRITVDRWGNVLSITDARDPNWKISYSYNYNNQQIDQTLNALTGDTKAAHSTTGYDALGRTVITSDFNGNTTRYGYDSNGNRRLEVHADGGQVIYDYNLFGERVSVTQPNTVINGVTLYGVTTRYAYDHLGHMTTVALASNQAGRKIDVYNATFYDVDGRDAPVYSSVDSLATTYAYDELGRNISITGADGAVSSTAYDLDGNVVMTIASYKPHGPQYSPRDGSLIKEDAQNITLNIYDAFHHLIGTKDANQRTMSWVTDAFGRVTRHTDLGGAEIVSEYNAAGQKVSLVTARYTGTYVESIRINYGYSGTLLTSIDQSATVIDILDSQNQVIQHNIGNDGMLTTYAYDLAGNRIREKQSYAPGNTNAPARVQNNTLTYDMQNRVVGIQDDLYTLTYTYDANGNRLSVRTQSAGKELGTVYNKFDVMNRQTIVNGDSADGGKTVVYGAHGHQLTYDLSGNRLSDTFIGLKVTYVDGYYYATGGNQSTTESYSYDALGRLATTQRDGITIDQRHYDAVSRVTESGFLDYVKQSNKNQWVTKSLQTMADQLGIESGSTTYHYDNNGRIQRQTIRGSDGNIGADYYYVDDSRMHDHGYIGGYDAVGNLLGYTLVSPDRKWEDYGRYSISYSAFDSYKEKTNQVFGGDISTSTYDVQGNRTSVTMANKIIGKYWYDAAGHVQSKIDYGQPGKTVDPKSSFALIVNDQVLGYEDGDANNILGSSYMSAHSGVLTAAPSAYTVQSVDETLQSIALAVWGDSKLWYLIADANGINAGDKLTVGRVLNIPTRINTVHNDYGTIKPYNAAEAIGNTTPAIPPPTHNGGGGCGGMGQLIIAAIVVVVAVFTQQYYLANYGTAAGAGAGAAGAGATGAAAAGTTYTTGSMIAAGAVGGAAGSIAGQAAGNILGLQQGFSWNQVAMSAIGGAVTTGVSELGAASSTDSMLYGSSWKAVAARAALSNTITQGINNVTGLQKGFSWTSVAASAAGAAVGNKVGSYLQQNDIFGSLGDIAAPIARASVTGFAAGLTTAIARGGKVTVNQIATDAFGNALGNSLADSMQSTTTSAPRTFVGSIGKDPSWMQGWSPANSPDQSTYSPVSAVDGATWTDDDSTYPKGKQYRFLTGGPAAEGAAGSQSDSAERQAEMARIIKQANEPQYQDAAPMRIEINGTSTSQSEIRPIGDVEGFFTFNPVGQALQSYGEAAYSFMRSPLTLLEGIGNLASDAYGFSKDELFGLEQGVMGDERPYQASNSIVRSVLDRGALATTGDLLAGGILSLPGISTVNAMAHNDSNAFAASLPGTFLAGFGARSFSVPNSIRSIETVTIGDVGSAAPEFVGPGIGRSGFKTSTEFAEASYQRYQSYVNDAYDVAKSAEDAGLLRGNPNTRIGNLVDRDSAARFRSWLNSEGISEGASDLVQMNRWLKDPAGTGLYVRPDIRIPSAGTILDATVGMKWSTDTQISRFNSFSNGNSTTVVRPQQLGGSYSIWP